MNKLFLTFALLCTFLFANAQRYADLDLEVLHPKGSITVPYGDSTHFIFKVTNNGPDTITTLDTLMLTATINGFHILFNMDTFKAYYSYLVPGDSMIDSLPQHFFIGSTFEFCFKIQPFSSTDTVYDTLMSGNTICTIVNNPPDSIDTTTVVSNQRLPGMVKIYPNPVHDYLHFDLAVDETSDVTIQLADITGRLVYQKQESLQANSKHSLSVNVSGLNRGFYLYRIMNGQQLLTGKVLLE